MKSNKINLVVILIAITVTSTFQNFASGQGQAESCICNAQYDPVCGSDGKTYSNFCRFNCAKRNYPNIMVAYKGECQVRGGEEEGCLCTQEYKPVCGSDGKTHSNPCQLMCAQKMNPNLTQKHTGPCADENMTMNKDCVCDKTYQPFCGTDNMTYENRCMLDCAKKNNTNLKIKFEGVCALPYVPDENGH